MAVNAVLPRASTDSMRQPSRFQEGSMNDRTSNKPPPHFLGPELEAYERQFYSNDPTSPTSRDPTNGQKHRTDRPLSAEAQLMTGSRNDLETSDPMRPPLSKKSSFFGRLRGAFGWGSNNNGQQQKPQLIQDDIKRKHASLQDYASPPPLPPPQQAQGPMRPPPRTWKSQSQVQIPHIPSIQNLNGAAGSSERPSREEILESYHHLMATGFFQAHAIQSTRQPAPRGHVSAQKPPSQATSTPAQVPPQPDRRPPPLPTIPSSGSGLDVENDTAASMLAALSATQANFKHSMDQSRGNSMDWQPEQGSRYAFRGRKRSRADGDEGNTTETSFAQPLKKMAKKIRKIPSTLTSTNNTVATSNDMMEPVTLQRSASLSRGGFIRKVDTGSQNRETSPAPDAIPVGSRRNAPRRSVSASGSIGGPNKLVRKRGRSPSRGKSRPPPVSRGGLEAASIRSSMESNTSRFDPNSDHPDGGALRSGRLRDRSRPPISNSLMARPYPNQNVPSVPRIPSIYKQQNVEISNSENVRPRAY